MATYKDLHGTRVNVVSSNPSNPKDGEVWFNSSLGILKGYVLGTASFCSGSNAPISRQSTAGGGNSTNAAFVCGGNAPSPTSAGQTTTIEYDGTNWASGGAMSNARRATSGAGTLTAGLAVAGGNNPPFNSTLTACEEYDGSSWTAGGALNSQRTSHAAWGTQTAGCMTSGEITAGPAVFGPTEEYDGSSWTATNNVNTQRASNCALGSQTAGLFIGAGPPGKLVEQYNGNTWTAVNELAQPSTSGFSAGTTSAGIIAGEYPNKTYSQEWDGTNWSTGTATLATGGSAGSSSKGAPSAGFVAMLGSNRVNKTEEFTGATQVVKTLTTS